VRTIEKPTSSNPRHVASRKEAEGGVELLDDLVKGTRIRLLPPPLRREDFKYHHQQGIESQLRSPLDPERFSAATGTNC